MEPNNHYDAIILGAGPAFISSDIFPIPDF